MWEQRRNPDRVCSDADSVADSVAVKRAVLQTEEICSACCMQLTAEQSIAEQKSLISGCVLHCKKNIEPDRVCSMIFSGDQQC